MSKNKVPEDICKLLFVYVEVLQPSQTISVMSSVVSSPNLTFTGQAYSSKWLTSTCAYSFAKN